MIVGDLTLNESIAKDSFKEVFLSSKKNSSVKYATKVTSKASLGKDDSIKPFFDQQIKILKEIHHPNIANLIEVKEDDKNFYIVQEYCNGGSLAKFLQKYYEKNNKGLPEEMAQYIMRQIVDALNYMHNKKIIYRNLKLENLLIRYEDENDKANEDIMKAKIKFTDFLFAKYLEKGELAKTVLGSPYTMSPLLLNKLTKAPNTEQLGYDKKADIWSLGIITYELLVGINPFDSENMDELINKINNGDYFIPAYLSKEAISFLNEMLQYEPQRRLSADKLFGHDFLKKNVKEFTKLDLEEIKNYLVIPINTRKNDELSKIFDKQ